MTSADDVVGARFPAMKFRHGYACVDVDTLLDRCVVAFRHYEEGGTAAAATVTSSEVRSAEFPLTRWREVYAADAVDPFLRQVADALARWEIVAR